MKYMLSSNTIYVTRCNMYLAKEQEMRSSKKEYEEVAKKCSSYRRTETSKLSNCVDCDCTSCLNCEHFAPDEHCVLDLYDPIAQTLK